MLPDREANDAVFRLTWSVLDALRSGSIWMPLTYFDLWMVRLMGFLPELSACMVCGRTLDGQRAWFHALADGLVCQQDRRIASSEMSAESRQIAAQIFRSRLEALNGADWPRERAADLRKFLMQIINRHLDRRLVTTSQLEKLE
jgi:DNA repair protein RecO (recombination protein O)